MNLPWFRMYTEAVDDPKLRLLAFEDRWHFIAVLCCKGQGIIDGGPELLDRMLAVKLGVQARELDEIKRRLMEVGLVDDCWQPTSWGKRQFVSDQDPTNAERQKRYRERHNGSHNVTVTLTDTDTDTEQNREEIVIALPTNTGEEFPIHETQCAEWGALFPAVNVPQELRNMRAWLIGNPAKRKTRSGMLRFVTSWLTKQQNEPRKPGSGKGRMTFADYHDGGN